MSPHRLLAWRTVLGVLLVANAIFATIGTALDRGLSAACAAIAFFLLIHAFTLSPKDG